MLKFKKNKLVECTEEEFEYLSKIVESSSCMASAASRIKFAILHNVLKWHVPGNRASTTEIAEMSLNAAMAVKYKYKYLKVTKGE